jgi:hypothetical protein
MASNKPPTDLRQLALIGKTSEPDVDWDSDTESDNGNTNYPFEGDRREQRNLAKSARTLFPNLRELILVDGFDKDVLRALLGVTWLDDEDPVLCWPAVTTITLALSHSHPEYHSKGSPRCHCNSYVHSEMFPLTLLISLVKARLKRGASLERVRLMIAENDLKKGSWSGYGLDFCLEKLRELVQVEVLTDPLEYTKLVDSLLR